MDKFSHFLPEINQCLGSSMVSLGLPVFLSLEEGLKPQPEYREDFSLVLLASYNEIWTARKLPCQILQTPPGVEKTLVQKKEINPIIKYWTDSRPTSKNIVLASLSKTGGGRWGLINQSQLINRHRATNWRCKHLGWDAKVTRICSCWWGPSASFVNLTRLSIFISFKTSIQNMLAKW